MLRKILLPLDGSELAEQALPFATMMAEKFQAELIVTRIAHPNIILSDYGSIAQANYIMAEQQETAAYLRRIDAQLAHSPFSVKIVPQCQVAPAEGIIDLANEEQVDLIVLSTHGRSGFSRLLHGSVATKLLRHAPCPVFLVKATDTVHREPDEAQAVAETVPIFEN